MFLIVTRNYPPDVGGIQILMGGLSESLLEHGPVKVFADSFQNSDSYDNKISADIIRTKGIKLFKKFRKANLVNDFINENSNIRAIFTDHWKSLELLKADYLKKTKVLCLIHSKEINHPIGTSLNKRMINALSKANFIIANSNFTKNLLIKLGYENKNIKVINPGSNYPIRVNEEAKNFAEKIYGDAFPKLITVSRLEGRKSHKNILMTIKNLLPKFPKLRYVSIGDGDEKNNLEKLREELGLSEHVKFIYKSAEQEKAGLLEKSDIFVMPSVIYKKSVEGFGITFIEAASYGKPSIAGKFGGEADAVLDGKTGYLCDGSDLSDLYETLLKVLDNEQYKKLGTNALEFSKNFSWNKIIKKYIELI